MEFANSEASHSSAASAADDWYFKVIGEELGPFTFDEVVSFAEQGHLSADAEVKAGISGAWSRMESVARLVAALPTQFTRPSVPPAPAPRSVQVQPTRHISPPPTPPIDVKKSKVDSLAETSKTPVETVALERNIPSPKNAPHAPPTTSVGGQVAESEVDEIQLIQLTTKQLVERIFARNCEKAWWAWIGGTEYGPVDFSQLIEWVVSGRLRTNDFVRFGTQAQYTLVATVPGLYHTANIAAQTAELRLFAKSHGVTVMNVSKASATTPSVQTSTPVTQPTAPTVTPPSQSSTPAITPQPAPVPPTPTTTAPASSSPADTKTTVPAAGTDSRNTGSRPPQVAAPRTPQEVNIPSTRAIATASIPVDKFRRAPQPSTMSLEKVMEWLKNPRLISGAFAVLLLLALLVGWFLSAPGVSSADIARYKELKQLLDDLKARRTAKATDFSEIQNRAEKLVKDYVPILERKTFSKHPAKEALLWTVRDVLPRVMKQDLKAESKVEKDFERRLDEVRKLLKIES